MTTSQIPHSDPAAIKPMATQRKDAWWVEPTLVAIGFGLFIIYATYRGLMGHSFEVETILSPFYSPPLLNGIAGLPFSPAIAILWMPAGFRATCYYYRKAYYRAYFLDPPGCAVGHFGGENYCGEAKGLLVLQNVHRYMLYLAILVIAFLWYDAIHSLFLLNGEFRLGLASVIMIANCILLSGYTFGCHAFRHLVGGRKDCFSCVGGQPNAAYSRWHFVTKLNEHHMLWAWMSLFSVGITDWYIWQVAAGHIVDPTFIGSVLPLVHIH
ncbi:MAG TPA: hypothetical protein V6D22_10335 [Candidatus Obscuribacterales bacterium]